MGPHDILTAMSFRYGIMRSYQDRGVVLAGRPRGAGTDPTSFATFFRRPAQFRFDWSMGLLDAEPPRAQTQGAVWSDGARVFLRPDRDGMIEHPQSLRRAIAGATGVSYGAAHTVSALLMAEVGGFTLPQLQRLTLQQGECDGVECHRIGGFHPRGTQFEVFVGIEDLLLRRVLNHDTAFEELRRDIRVDEDIEERVFQ